MGVTWGDTRIVKRMLQGLPSNFFKELESLLGHMWPSVVLEKHYHSWELAFVLDGLFEPQQCVAVSLNLYNSSVCWSGGIHHKTNCENNSPEMRIFKQSQYYQVQLGIPLHILDNTLTDLTVLSKTFWITQWDLLTTGFWYNANTAKVFLFGHTYLSN